ncbi:MAG: hypothetical protein JWN98_1349 [Abditibacteriota bacterium]|nr:hypothetical protein [Abditibacteriota bacterium]
MNNAMRSEPLNSELLQSGPLKSEAVGHEPDRCADTRRAWRWLAMGTAISAIVLHLVFLLSRSPQWRSLDPYLLKVWYQATPPAFSAFLYGLSRIVTVVVLWPLLGFTSWIFWRKNRWYDALGLLCAITLPAVIALAAKQLYHVPRPQVMWATGGNWSHAYPSGHVALIMTLGGMTAYLGRREGKSVAWTIVVALLTFVGTLLMGYGRVALGAHFFTDILGGLTLGIIWLPVSITITNALRAASLKSSTQTPITDPNKVL